MWDSLLLLVLGWLLGLLAPVIVDKIRAEREAESGRKAIRAELDELGTVLVVAAFQARKAAGTINRPFLEWMLQCLKNDASHKEEALQAAVESALSASDADLAKGAPLLAIASGKASMLQHYPAPLLNTRVAALWSFSTDYQRRLLQVHKNIALLDAVVEQFREYFRLTFVELDSTNRAAVMANIQQCYENYAQRARIIVNQIVALPTACGAQQIAAADRHPATRAAGG